MSNWNNNGRRAVFPESVRRQARRELPQHCAQCGHTGHLWLDHIIPVAEGGPDTIDNAQWLCTDCHDIKTAAERARGQQRRVNRGRHPAESHPGLRA